MKKRSFLIVLLILSMVFASCALLGCKKFVSYGYTIHFFVINGKGRLVPKNNQKLTESPYMTDAGENKDGISYTFLATPDVGYCIKRWTVDSQEVLDEKGQVFTGGQCDVDLAGKTYTAVVTVEFELIPDDAQSTPLADNYTEDQHLERVKNRINARYIASGLYQSYDISSIYNEYQELAYFVVDFQPSGYVYIKINEQATSDTDMYLRNVEESQLWRKYYVDVDGDMLGWNGLEDAVNQKFITDPLYPDNVKFLATKDGDYIYETQSHFYEYINIYPASKPALIAVEINEGVSYLPIVIIGGNQDFDNKIACLPIWNGLPFAYNTEAKETEPLVENEKYYLIEDMPTINLNFNFSHNLYYL